MKRYLQYTDKDGKTVLELLEDTDKDIKKPTREEIRREDFWCNVHASIAAFISTLMIVLLIIWAITIVH